MIDLPTIEGGWPCILADPPWSFKAWSGKGTSRAADNHYQTQEMDFLGSLNLASVAAADCALFCWIVWPVLPDALKIINNWGFAYKTCAFSWVKADPRQIEMFRDDIDVGMGLGYWTRANSEVCLLATRGSPKRLNANVRQAIVEPRREHSRKPDCVYERIERLVKGPYLELFARASRPGWTVWGDETTKFDALAAASASLTA